MAQSFSNAQDFTIEGGTFNQAETLHVDHSTTYKLNVIIVSPEGSQPQPVDLSRDFGYLLDPEKLEKFISQTVLIADDGQDILVSEQSGSSSIEHTLKNGLIVNEAGERPAAKPEPERPLKVVQEVEKRLTIYTGVDKALKKLKKSITVAFTLTPATPHESGAPWAAVIWKVLQFEKTTTSRHQIQWTSQTGFCRVEELDDGTLQPGALRSVVKPRDATILQIVDGDEEFTKRMEVPFKADEMRGIFNLTGSDQRVALCTIDSKKPESNQFSPVVDLVVESDVRQFFASGPPTMLQAFVVPPGEYQERQPVDTSALLRPLFINAKTSAPEPIDVSKLSKPITGFRLYSDPSGKVVLEKDR